MLKALSHALAPPAPSQALSLVTVGSRSASAEAMMQRQKAIGKWLRRSAAMNVVGESLQVTG